jgi:hypothetical protein
MADIPKLSEQMSQLTELAEIKNATLEDLKKLPLENKDIKNALSASIVKVEELLLSQKDVISALSEADKKLLEKDLAQALLITGGTPEKAQELFRFFANEFTELELTVSFNENVVENEGTDNNMTESDLLSIDYANLKNLTEAQMKSLSDIFFVVITTSVSKGKEWAQTPESKTVIDGFVKQLVEKSKTGEVLTDEMVITLLGTEINTKTDLEFPTEQVLAQLKKQDAEIQQVQENNRTAYESSDVFASIDTNLRTFLNQLSNTETIKKMGGIGVLMEQAKLANPEDPKSALKESLKKLVFEELQGWAENNLKAVQERQKRAARDELSALDPESGYTGGVTSKLTQATEWAGKITGTGALAQYQHITENEFLFNALGRDAELAKQIEAQLEMGNFNPNEYESMVSTGVDNILENTDFEAINTNYRVLKIERGQDQDVDLLISKMAGVGEEYWGSKYEKNYRNYVEKTGPAATEFDEWISNQDMGMIERITFLLKRLFSGFFKDGEFSFGNIMDSKEEESESTLVKGLRELKSDFVPAVDAETGKTQEVDYNFPPEFSYLSGKVETTGDNAVKIEELPTDLFVDKERSSFKPEVKNLFDLGQFWSADLKLGKTEFALLGKLSKKMEGSGFSETKGEGEKYQVFEGGKLVEKETENEGDAILSLDMQDGFWGSLNPFGDGNNFSFDSADTLFAWLKENESTLDEKS